VHRIQHSEGAGVIMPSLALFSIPQSSMARKVACRESRKLSIPGTVPTSLSPMPTIAIAYASAVPLLLLF